MYSQNEVRFNEPKLLTVNAAHFFGKSLCEVYKFYGIKKYTIYELFSVFLKYLYRQRKYKNFLNESEIYLTYKDFKSLLHNHCIFIREFLGIEVKHQKVLSIFLNNLNCLSLKKADKIKIQNLTFYYLKNTDEMLTQCLPFFKKSNAVNKLGIKVFKMLVFRSKVSEIPLELALILLCDAQMITKINKELFKDGTKVFKTHILESAIMMMYQEFFSGKINITGEKLYIRNEIPKYDDFHFILATKMKPVTFSLPYLVDFFGHKVWYEEFINFNEDESNFFKFSLENYLD